MKIDLSQFRATFLEESAEHIVSIENGLLQLKTSGVDDETLNSIFRAAHSIKGGAGAFGLTNVVAFTHVLENLFDGMREHKVAASADLVALLLHANDLLKELINAQDDSVPPDMAGVKAELEKALSNGSATGGSPAPEKHPAESAVVEALYLISFRPSADIFVFGSDPLLLLRNLDRLGQVTSVKADIASVPTLNKVKTDVCYLSWQVELKTTAPRADIEEIFEFVLDCAAIEITAQVANQVANQLPEAAQSSSTGKQTAAKAEGSSVRVPTEKIDQLIDLVGEMVIAHSITTRLVENLSADNVDALQGSVAILERHIRELHERAMSVRMVPVGSLFSRFHRLVHDLAAKTGKQIKLITEGDETEVDRSILELLGDPLTHVIRNSADHGIESPADRTRSGKNVEGTILLRASHLAGNILIEILDDGAGLDLSRIRAKAIAKNLISPDAVLTDEQVRLLIFEPGFSTKEEVSDLSGRGVGMDVVRRNVASLNGSLTLDSEAGAGTHIKVQLPLTLAIMEGLTVRVGEHNFVVPLFSIVETICLSPEQLVNIAGKGEAAVVRDKALPLLRLDRVFGLDRSYDAQEPLEKHRALAVVVEHNGQHAAFQIDELLGQQQIVVKSLERNFTRIDGALGATILGDGRTALILDVRALLMRNSGGSLYPKSRMSLVA